MAKLQSHELDSFDRAILERLQVDNTTPLRVIGEQVNLSTAATQRRIRRLEERGVIQGNTAVIDPESVGRPITIMVEVQAERTRSADLDAMKAELSGPEIQQCYYVTGDADFMLVLTVASMADYETLARRLFYENPNVKLFKTIVLGSAARSCSLTVGESTAPADAMTIKVDVSYAAPARVSASTRGLAIASPTSVIVVAFSSPTSSSTRTASKLLPGCSTTLPPENKQMSAVHCAAP